MEQLPGRVKTLLQSNANDRIGCSHCGELLHLQNDKLFCLGCHLPQYCSQMCLRNHVPAHQERCERYKAEMSCQDFATSSQAMVKAADELIKMGFHCDQLQNRNYYFRKALQLCIKGILVTGNRNNNNRGSQLEDRALMLMVILGGDAQLLLDWLSFTALELGSSNNHDMPPASAESQEKIKHPLLALHGLFDNDTKDRKETTLANLYLLVCCRSLADHRRKKQSFQAYQCTIRLGEDRGEIPQKLTTMDGTIATFLWGPHEYEYGENLEEEIARILRHIQMHKNGGTFFLNYVGNSVANFSPQKAPGLLTNSPGSPLSSDFVSPVLPEFWLLYQECFLAMKPELDLNEFLTEEDSKPPAKDKKD